MHNITIHLTSYRLRLQLPGDFGRWGMKENGDAIGYDNNN
jgi:hypothetical protein